MKSNKILNRIQIKINDKNDKSLITFYNDWLKLIEMQKDINIKPNVIEFNWLPGYIFYGLKYDENSKSDNCLNHTFIYDNYVKIDDNDFAGHLGYDISSQTYLNETTLNFICTKFINKK